ncbi:MAG TPA: glycoside hydrolase family 44 protein, partial [Polyangiaceae bacterium]|nr:glycoside hydrolase family 44 protein [Polyangiaceae bacterium]
TISPLIYGVANAGDEPRDMKAAAYRFGGNPASRFNWSLGNAWNTGNDWYFQNVNAGPVWEHLIGASVEREVPLTVTIPMLGWVARDDHSYSYPVSAFGAQTSVDPEHPDVGNGVSKRAGPIRAGDPLRTSIPAPPELIRKWVEMIVKESQQRGRPVHSYILDNEPNLWSSTHRDVHPEPLGYDELLERTIRYGSAIRAADPDAIIAGPAEWGWSNYFWSAKDAASGFTLRPDRRAHGDMPLLDWYLSKLREHEAKSGVRVLDVVDLHFYPQGKNLYAAGGEGGTDPETSQRRIRATRALWDPTYADESWINERIHLLPRLKDIIERNYPGRRISIGEWNFGAEAHISGGLATAEALGRFAQAGIYSAYFWLAPRAGTPAYWAFRAYRNFDGQGGAFLDHFVRTTSPKEVSIFASSNAEQSRHVLVIVVPTSESSFRLNFRLTNCKPVTAWRTFVYASTSKGLVPSKLGGDGNVADVFPPHSIGVLELNSQREVPIDHGG